MTTTFTRDNGDFQFDGLRNGDYIIEVNVKDYEQFQQTVTITGASRLGISIFLTKSGKARESGCAVVDLGPSTQRPAQSP